MGLTNLPQPSGGVPESAPPLQLNDAPAAPPPASLGEQLSAQLTTTYNTVAGPDQPPSDSDSTSGAMEPSDPQPANIYREVQGFVGKVMTVVTSPI
jgi:hypothetical protein